MAKFILDNQLGNLAKHLRLLGFDTVYNNQLSPREIIELSIESNSIYLTRSKQLPTHSHLERYLCLDSNTPIDQCAEIMAKLDLWTDILPFSRCLVCNQVLESISRNSTTSNKIEALIPPAVKEWSLEYHYCPHCHKVYWQGSHWERMNTWINRLYEINQSD